ncbi:hypothetical protein NDU88_003490 [Pleurodeles waltl]|uniref:Uncharacterized protein n=1 Tax=Pleurodeles waltl TaxID=8319 RepID=A0AAV7TPA9_PLEWA|nr:hypothetical protein NDU88_003490 [Pleurodeles waltl]
MEQVAQHWKARNHRPRLRNGNGTRAEARKRETRGKRPTTMKQRPRDPARKQRRTMNPHLVGGRWCRWCRVGHVSDLLRSARRGRAAAVAVAILGGCKPGEDCLFCRCVSRLHSG